MRKSERLRLQLAIVIILLLVLVTGVVIGVRHLLGTPPLAPEKVIRQISVLKPLPPPPPPPEVEKPPEPEIEEKIEEPEPEQEPEPLPDAPPDAPPPGPDLGLDAEGVAGSDAFGLAARKGGRGLAGSGGGRFEWYAGQVRRGIEDELLGFDDLRKAAYQVDVQIWVDERGGIRRYEITRGTGKPELDSRIRVALGQLHGIPETPPPGMPQPIKLRIKAQL